ncbi:unnamed protein product [Paramecium primaurelia]|uniref:LRAT domain-containing protein n=1 Tax=Paramecium primaurelia TaxID=5886 RepID=A0A8S1LQK6_PARPR|nr:unnamed protein product [Paramecium primaurelia]
MEFLCVKFFFQIQSWVSKVIFRDCLERRNQYSSGMLSSSTSQIPIVTNFIILTKICSQFLPKFSSLQKDSERKPIIIPYQDDHKQLFKQKNIKNVYQCKRENKYSLKQYPMAKLITEHTDTIICSDNTCMLASFHENMHRVDQGIYKKGQASQVYVECYEYLPTKQIQFSDAQDIIDELKKERYELFNNNCQHSSNKIIQKLDLKFNDLINLERL